MLWSVCELALAFNGAIYAAQPYKNSRFAQKLGLTQEELPLAYAKRVRAVNTVELNIRPSISSRAVQRAEQGSASLKTARSLAWFFGVGLESILVNGDVDPATPMILNGVTTRYHPFSSYVIRLGPGRTPVDGQNLEWLKEEERLRYKDYMNSFRSTFPNSFFDDSDMHEPYSLVVIVAESSIGGPKIAASARVYSAPEDIRHELDGVYVQSWPNGREKRTNLLNRFRCEVQQRECSLIDRLILDVSAFPGLHDEALQVLFKSIAQACREVKVFFALARRNRKESLLQRYLPLGFEVAGQIRKKICFNTDAFTHWVLVGRRGEMLDRMKRNSMLWQELGALQL